MSLARVHNFSVSLDGFGTGEGLSLEAPFGHAGHRLHEWMFATRWGRRELLGQPGGSAGIDDALARKSTPGIGAEIHLPQDSGGHGIQGLWERSGVSEFTIARFPSHRWGGRHATVNFNLGVGEGPGTSATTDCPGGDPDRRTARSTGQPYRRNLVVAARFASRARTPLPFPPPATSSVDADEISHRGVANRTLPGTRSGRR